MKFREFITSSDRIVYGGKNAENNEELVKQVKVDDVVLHTSKPGSPFVNVGGKPTKKDIYEAGVFCARYSQDWRDSKQNVIVHVFHGKDIHKEPGMKLGTFGVKNFKEIKISKIDIKNFEERKF